MRLEAVPRHALGAALLITLYTSAGAAQVDEPPVPPVAGQPNLPDVSPELVDAVRALRVTARRLNRCTWDSREGFADGPSACDAWSSEVARAPDDVRVHAIGLELVRETMITRTSDVIRARGFHRLWFSALEEAQAVPYLLRALDNMAAESWNAPYWFHQAIRTVYRVTMHHVARLDEIEPPEIRDEYMRWYREHGQQSEAQWRLDGIAAMTERIYAVESHSRWVAAAVFTDRFFQALHRAERRPFCTEVLGSPRLTRRVMRRLLEQRCARTRMSARQMLRLRRASERERREADRAEP